MLKTILMRKIDEAQVVSYKMASAVSFMAVLAGKLELVSLSRTYRRGGERAVQSKRLKRSHLVSFHLTSSVRLGFVVVVVHALLLWSC